MQFVVYRGVDEVIVTTPSEEEETIREWFTEGGRELFNYDREEYDEHAVEIKAHLMMG
jgi:hypothetical protein